MIFVYEENDKSKVFDMLDAVDKSIDGIEATYDEFVAYHRKHKKDGFNINVFAKDGKLAHEYEEVVEIEKPEVPEVKPRPPKPTLESVQKSVDGVDGTTTKLDVGQEGSKTTQESIQNHLQFLDDDMYYMGADIEDTKNDVAEMKEMLKQLLKK